MTEPRDGTPDEPAEEPATTEPAPEPAPPEEMTGMADELACVASWLEQHAGRIRLERSEGTLASVLPRLPDVRPRVSPRARRG